MDVQVVVEASSRLSHDLFHVYILPHVLSEHLHELLVTSKVPNWHAFSTLPLVSLAFHDTCQVLNAGIFGSAIGSDIDGILSATQSLWHQAKLPPQECHLLAQDAYQGLMSGNSLIGVYVCTALARSFLNVDVLWPISLHGRARSLIGYYDPSGYGKEEYGATSQDSDLERRPEFELRDDLTHRVYLPLTCAVALCDSVRPERLAYIAAAYLAELVPVYSTAPVLLKYAQDLETYVARVHRVDMETWEHWTLQTLGLVGDTGQLPQQIYIMGKLVRSFSRLSGIPSAVLEATNVVNALHDVKCASWSARTAEIRARASSLLQDWGATR